MPYLSLHKLFYLYTRATTTISILTIPLKPISQWHHHCIYSNMPFIMYIFTLILHLNVPLISMLMSQSPYYFHDIHCISDSSTKTIAAAPLLFYPLHYGSSVVFLKKNLCFCIYYHITTPVSIFPYSMPPLLHIWFRCLCFTMPLPHHWCPQNLFSATYVSIFLYRSFFFGCNYIPADDKFSAVI